MTSMRRLPSLWAWLLACASLLGACGVRKGQPSGAELRRAVAEWNATSEPKDRIVCRLERVPDSHFKERVCRYQWQIDEGRRDARASLEELDYESEQVTGVRR